MVGILDSRALTGHFCLLETDDVSIQLVQNAPHGHGGTVAGFLINYPLEGTSDPINVPAHHAQHLDNKTQHLPNRAEPTGKRIAGLSEDVQARPSARICAGFLVRATEE